MEVVISSPKQFWNTIRHENRRNNKNKMHHNLNVKAVVQ